MMLAQNLGINYKGNKEEYFMNDTVELFPEIIGFSWKDKLNKIRLPKSLSEDLAYLVGIHIGDGFMNIYNRGYQIDYTQGIYGSNINDKLWHLRVVAPLFNKLFNLNLKSRLNCAGCHSLYFHSKAMTTFYNKCLKLPLGKKSDIINIPEIILSAGLDYSLPCLRGIFDTDFTFSFKNKNKTVHNYPIIELKCSSKPLISTISKILSKIDINYFTAERLISDPRFKTVTKQFSVTVSGKKNARKWFNLIGSRNPSYLSRYALWRKYGFCPPYTNYLQRRAMLLGELDPYSFYKNGQDEI